MSSVYLSLSQFKILMKNNKILSFPCSVILACLTGIAVLCTLIEAWLIFYNNNFAKKSPSLQSTTNNGTTEGVYENAAYEPGAEGNGEQIM